MEKTPFRTVYTKKSNFVTQSFFTDAIPIDYGGSGNFVIPRHGDFVTRMYLLIDYPSSASTTVNQAHAMIDYIEFIVGGKIIQRETGETLNMRVNLTETDNDTFSPNQLYRMLGGGPQYPFTDTVQYPRPYRLHVPLPMWFAGDPSQAFPLAALRYQELEVNIGFRTANRWGGVDTGVSGSNVCLHIEYGYMDNEVLETFIKQPLLYPVEQFQVLEPPAYTGGDSVIYIPSQDYTTSEGTSFINPVKALFVLYKDLATETTNIFDYSRGKTFAQLTSPDDNDFLNSMEVVLDGQVMLPEEAGTFELLRGYEYYAHFPGCTQRIFFGEDQRYYSYIYALSFCQDPMNKKDPNGSINFSVVKNPSIKLDSKKRGFDFTIQGSIFPNVDNGYLVFQSIRNTSDGNPESIELDIGDFIEYENYLKNVKVTGVYNPAVPLYTTNLKVVDFPTELGDPDIGRNYEIVKANIGTRIRVYALSVNFLYIENGVARLLFDASENNFPKFP
jgi:hypothetical protein